MTASSSMPDALDDRAREIQRLIHQGDPLQGFDLALDLMESLGHGTLIVNN